MRPRRLIPLVAGALLSLFIVVAVASEPGVDTAWTFTGSSSDTHLGGGGPLDGAVGLGIRNKDTTPGNYAFQAFQSLDTAGQVYNGCVWASRFISHEAAGPKPTELGLWCQMGDRDALTQMLWARWDVDQGGAVFGLGTPGTRQGLNLDYRLPIVFIGPNGEAVTAFKCGIVNTCQIGDSHTGPGTPHVLQAPVVAGGWANVSGDPFVIKGGGSTGAAPGGPVQFWVAQAGASGALRNEPLLVAEVTGDDLLVDGVSFNALVARIAALERRLMIQGGK